MAQYVTIKAEPAWDEGDEKAATSCVIKNEICVDGDETVPQGASFESIFNVKMENVGKEMDNEDGEIQLETVKDMSIKYEMAGEADIEDVHSVKLDTEEDWKKEEHDEDNQEHASGIIIITESLFCKEETILEMAGDADVEDPLYGKLEMGEDCIKEYNNNDERI